MGVCIERVYVCVYLCTCAAANRCDEDWKAGSNRVLRPTCAINHSHLILFTSAAGSRTDERRSDGDLKYLRRDRNAQDEARKTTQAA